VFSVPDPIRDFFCLKYMHLN